jgi:hypothetical protein
MEKSDRGESALDVARNCVGVIAMMALGERTLIERAHHEGDGQVGFGGVVGIEFQEALVKMRDKPCRSGGGGY